MQNYIRLGLSGCKLELINDSVIRKISQSTIYNTRFEKQIQKQQQFSTITLPNVMAPKILDVGYVDNLLYADMEYVDSKLFTEQFLYTSVNRYTDTLMNYIDYTKHTTAMYTSEDIKQLLCDKLAQLRPASRYTALIDYTIAYITASNVAPIEKNICHGDLTLSNILFADNDLYFIDFLDSYMESFIIDLVKLKQDLHYKWNTTILNNTSPQVETALNEMWGAIEHKYAAYIHTELFYVLDVINYLRIEPYITVITRNHYYMLDSIIKSTKLFQLYTQS